MSSAGHEVVLIAKSNEAIDEEINPGFRVIGLEPRHKHIHHPNPSGEAYNHPAYPYNILADAPAFSYQMAEEVISLSQLLPAPDIIESQEYAALPYYLIQRKLTERTILEQIPILVHLHSPDFELARSNQAPRYRFPEYWIGQMVKFCVRAADELLSSSHFLANSVKQTLQLSSDITIIPYPALSYNESAPGASAQPGNIVYAGPLEVRRGILPLLKACHRLWLKGEDFRLTLIGGDCHIMPLDTPVSALMDKRYGQWIRSGHLQWLGQLDYSAVLKHMKEAWAVVVPSVWDNLPYECIDAMGIGQIVLGSSAGGQAELIGTNGVNGFIFDWQIPGDFEQRLIKIFHLDPEERLNITQRAQSRIHSLCDPEVVLLRRIKHFQKIIGGYSPKRLFPGPNYRLRGSTSNDEDQVSSQMTTLRDEQAGLLSVLIPYYNLGDYLNETLDNVLTSTYSPLEVIIINDGSTDPKSLDVLREIEERGIPNVLILHTENQGVALARNYGAENARGEFIAFLDADDMVEPDFFQRAIDVLLRYPNVTFVSSWIRYFGNLKAVTPTWNAEFPYLLGNNMLVVSSVVRRLSFLNSAKNKKEFEYNLEDYESWISLLEAGGIGVSLTSPLVRVRVRPDSRYKACDLNQRLYLYDLMTQHHPDLYREWGMELFNLQCANGPGYVWNPAAGVPENLRASGAPLDYHIAAQLVNRIRNMRIVQNILKNAAIKEFLRSVLIKFQKYI